MGTAFKDYNISVDLPIKRFLHSFLFLVILLSFQSVSAREGYWERQLRLYGKMNLPVKTLLQFKLTSCGPAAITMAYNYAYPETRITEGKVIEYAADAGYYTERELPFTSPENMVRIADHYAEAVLTGNVKTADEGLSLLKEKLLGGDPVLIDIFTVLDDPTSGAHFVLVTGLILDTKNPNATRIHFNDPQTGTNRSAYWLGGEGIWNAWKNNTDVGGSGWWMMIPSP